MTAAQECPVVQQHASIQKKCEDSFYFTGEVAPNQLLFWKANGDVSSHLHDCQYLKMQCQDPIVPATAQMEQKAAPTGKQTARQEARAMPIYKDRLLLGGMPGSHPALSLLCPRSGVRADSKEDK